MMATRKLPAAKAVATLKARGLSAAAGSRTVRDMLDEKRGYRAGDDLKAYLKQQFAQLTIPATASVAEMLDKLVASQTSVLVVMAPDNSIAGLVSDRDYIKLAQKRAKSGGGAAAAADASTSVRDIMTPASKLVTVDYTDSAERCQELMFKNKIRFLPVLFQGKLHGIVTHTDFLAQPSRFEPEIRRALLGEEGVHVISDDYSFALTDLESDKLKAELAKRVEAVKNRKL